MEVDKESTKLTSARILAQTYSQGFYFYVVCGGIILSKKNQRAVRSCPEGWHGLMEVEILKGCTVMMDILEIIDRAVGRGGKLHMKRK